ncbi:MAG: SemiSWEET transporter [Candidatus Bathyarchaeia archaeon]|jgi:MtN3 and saliva related transmembrane protein
MDAITILGLTAALFTTVSLLPQLMKAYKTKSTKDVSTGMFILFCGGVFLWLLYGVFVHDFPIIIANSLAFIQAVVILFFKVKYR